MSDTIAAIATPPGEGGIGIIRLSGPDAQSIALKIFRPARPGRLRSHRVRYGHVIGPDGAVIDEALLTLMAAPHSFTREDVVEISCHGGALPVQLTLEAALAAGARLANPGEFTMRAFLNGRIDLSQAEATLDIIRAQTSAGLAVAQAQLGGWLAREVRAARAALLEPLAYITALIDFPEEGIEPQAVAEPIAQALATVERLLAGADQGIVIRNGARVALVGRPNVGKSSLLNALLRVERAIVTPIPGTTRDTLEETANLAGVPVVLIDTAGMRASTDPVEQIGVERAAAALASADLALLVFDAQQPFTAEDEAMLTVTADRPTIIVWNKCDDPTMAPPPAPAHPRSVAIVACSARYGHGIDTLAKTIATTLLGGTLPAVGSTHLVSNPRHRAALRRAAECLRAAQETLAANAATDLLAADLTGAANALGEITGETVGEDLLDVIFSRFCIGK
ncbi:tRNA uridine-5-carboxymethylaminomethyl(34) synthesis GTPase MnmE [Chloroflexus sp.]|uniref:tRNA uridine-5-carboxymethylaminomethyl(34) synthesis GTPase MnmE n=1 Tax=Chloroflexus sp. TaxID=1904827 RepID=UPI00298F11F3|nr:tRNA uridine-5-carboxymethylaminomethyl(34) synthesis GTPase MnmE [Chloroflexus sp.]MCX7861144.1 tRNA uridine-5-carboxymethylaminomethyl(34) synthesis GTPase MnmE [Chloroflexus sp.]MDW8405631.1 tRNA uridine-5-carboxymethylaminomethyl(34) synthesis GTPase MnmE [Chloroflexus sp.]